MITCHRQLGQQLNYHQDILVQNPIYSQTLI
ncbi:TPA: type IV secretion protein Rhs, partial [Escherichia coli]|nr:type IV secretion protein Rhs [Escherichia coli]HAJ2977061.1 type IV secretion protein Rhs [Escherichia coli]